MRDDLHLHLIAPHRNMARFYSMSVQPNLFGEWALFRECAAASMSAISALTLASHSANGMMVVMCWPTSRCSRTVRACRASPGSKLAGWIRRQTCGTSRRSLWPTLAAAVPRDPANARRFSNACPSAWAATARHPTSRLCSIVTRRCSNVPSSRRHLSSARTRHLRSAVRCAINLTLSH